MIEEEFKTILDRELFPQIVKKHYAGTLDLLKEITNYGARLIVRSFSLTKREVKDIVVIANLLKQAVTFLDAIEILVSQGAIISSALPLRSLFEVKLYISWILNRDSDIRARSYYVWHLRKKFTINNIGIDGTKENLNLKKILETINRENILDIIQINQDEIKNQNKQIEELLNQEWYKTINDEFNRLEEKKKYGCKWYSLDSGPKNLRDMSKKLYMEDEYTIFYTHLSRIVHGISVENQVQIKEGRVIFKHVRNLKEIKTILMSTLNNALSLYRSILEFYLPNEIENFNRKYVNEWRERFRNIPDIKFESSGTVNI